MPVLLVLVGLGLIAALLATLGSYPARRAFRTTGRGLRTAATALLDRLEERCGHPLALLLWFAGWFAVLLLHTVALGTVVTRLGPETWLGELDRVVSAYFAGARTDGATTAMRLASDIGDSITMVMLGVLVGFTWRLRRGTWVAFGVLAASFLGALSLYRLGKLVVGRERPGQEFALEEVAGLAFPSGHATGATAFYVAFVLLIGTLGLAWALKVWLLAGAATVAVMVAVSRIYLGVHWLSDVIVGMLLGGTWAVVVMTPSWQRRRARPSDVTLEGSAEGRQP